MQFNRNRVLILLVILLAVIGAVVWYFAFFSIEEEASTNNAKNSISIEQPEKKDDNEFATLKGDDFDEAFVAGMIAHHDGAINMAERSMAYTAHKEIRTLSWDIIQTQSKEMIQMRNWQKEWGFKITNTGGHLSHSGGGEKMAGDMVEMTNKLVDLKGDDFDKEFLTQMILHHEQAIEMAQYAEQNAKRQEVKDIASDIMTAQDVEIAQMKRWQQDWGY